MGQLIKGAQDEGNPPRDELLVLAPSAATFFIAFEPILETGAVFLLAHGLRAGAESFLQRFMLGTFHRYLRLMRTVFISHHRTHILREDRGSHTVSIMEDLFKQIHLLFNFIDHLELKAIHAANTRMVKILWPSYKHQDLNSDRRRISLEGLLPEALSTCKTKEK